MNELGKNMWLLALDNSWLLLDAGSAFPENEMLGVDMVIPDVSYLLANKSKLKGIILSHAHLDHFGALPYLLDKISVPIYGSPLTVAVVRHYLSGYTQAKPPVFHTVAPGERFSVAGISCEMLAVNHDLPQCCGVAVATPQGWVVYTGDFKVDYTPVVGTPIDLARLGQLGQEGVLCLLADSTNAELAGSTLSESSMGKRLEQALKEAGERIVVHLSGYDLLRLQQLLWLAAEQKLQLQIVSPDVQQMMAVAVQAGALQLPPQTPNSKRRGEPGIRPRQLVITSTPAGEHYLAPLLGVGYGRNLVQRGDTVIITGARIPGSEKLEQEVINSLYKQGVARVVEIKSDGVYSSHAARDELKLVLTLTRPQNFVPMHGETRQLVQHKELARELGWREEQIHLPANGKLITFAQGQGAIKGVVPAGNLLLEGFGTSDSGGVVLRDRQQLSEEGLLVAVITVHRENGRLLGEPQLWNQGFVYQKEATDLFAELQEKVKQLAQEMSAAGKYDWTTLKNSSRDIISKTIYERTHRRPVVLVTVMEIRSHNR